jgi:hypothetical protein
MINLLVTPGTSVFAAVVSANLAVIITMVNEFERSFVTLAFALSGVSEVKFTVVNRKNSNSKIFQNLRKPLIFHADLSQTSKPHTVIHFFMAYFTILSSVTHYIQRGMKC